MRIPFRDLLIAAGTLLFAFASSPSVAQTPSGDAEERVNYAYTTGDTAFFNVVGQSVQAVRLPISYTVRSLDDHPWGAKLHFPVSVGFHELTADDPFSGLLLKEKLATISALAGVEFQVPVSRRWTLAPFAELGAGRDLDGGEMAWIYSAGMAGVMEIEREKALFRIGAGLAYDGATLAGGGPSDGYTTLETGLDVRFPIRGSILGRRADWSVYGMRRRFLSPLFFDQLDGERIELRNQNEIGFTLGIEQPWKLWLLKVDRLGLGLRFGESLFSVRILFGVPF